MPGKVARLHLEDDDELAFEFRLAKDLSMTVARLRAEMTSTEFLYWSRWYVMRDQEREVAARAGG